MRCELCRQGEHDACTGCDCRICGDDGERPDWISEVREAIRAAKQRKQER